MENRKQILHSNVSYLNGSLKCRCRRVELWGYYTVIAFSGITEEVKRIF